MSPEIEIYVCCVCTEQVDDSNSSECNGCGQRYHLNQRNDIPGKDCGDVWINDYTLALEFGCQTCIDAVPVEVPQIAADFGMAGLGAPPFMQPPVMQPPVMQPSMASQEVPPSSPPPTLRSPRGQPAERKRRYRKWE